MLLIVDDVVIRCWSCCCCCSSSSCCCCCWCWYCCNSLLKLSIVDVAGATASFFMGSSIIAQVEISWIHYLCFTRQATDHDNIPFMLFRCRCRCRSLEGLQLIASRLQLQGLQLIASRLQLQGLQLIASRLQLQGLQLIASRCPTWPFISQNVVSCPVFIKPEFSEFSKYSNQIVEN